MQYHLKSSLLAALLLTGCSVGPIYQAPKINLPETFSVPSSQSTNLTQWWTHFNDDILTHLITAALSNNLDIQQAASRVRQVRAQESITAGALGPKLNVGAQQSYTRLSKNSFSSALTGLGGGQGQSGSGIGLPGEDFNTYQTGFDASWEIDLFGGQQKLNEAAAARTSSAQWSQYDAKVMIAAEVAKNYMQFRSLQHRIELANQTLSADKEILDIARVRLSKGLVNSLDKNQQQQVINQQSAEIENLNAQLDINIHALSLLLGLQPNALTEELSQKSLQPKEILEIPVGLPSDLLRRRPDIREAEQNMIASNADIGSATADLYPKFSLTGALQLVSTSLSSILESDSRQINGGGKISLPLFDRGVRKSTIELRKAEESEAFILYQKKILTALRDVEDALSQLDADKTRIKNMQLSERVAKDTLDTITVRYKHGLVPLNDVLTARKDWLSIQDALDQVLASAHQNSIALYKALGGGWDERRVKEEE